MKVEMIGVDKLIPYARVDLLFHAPTVTALSAVCEAP